MSSEIFFDHTRTPTKFPLVRDVIEIADRLYPNELTETWDNSGLQIGELDAVIDKIAFSLDAVQDSITFAINNACSLLITHHPLIFTPLKSITSENIIGKLLLKAAKTDLAILSLHTNLDAATNGLNDHLATLIGLMNISVPSGAMCARIGSLDKPLPVSELAHRLKTLLELESVNVISRDDREVGRVFLVSGSGMTYLSTARIEKADVIITGDVKYHSALEALQLDIPVLDAGHFGLEKCCVPLMLNQFEKEFSRLGFQSKLFAYYQLNPYTTI